MAENAAFGICKTRLYLDKRYNSWDIEKSHDKLEGHSGLLLGYLAIYLLTIFI